MAAHLVARRLVLVVVFRLAAAGDAAAEIVAAVPQALAVFAREHQAFFGGDDRRERQVVVGGEREIEGRFQGEAELGVGADRGREEAGLALHARVRMGEIGGVEDRHAVELEKGVLVGDLLLHLVMGHPGGGDLPERRAVGVLVLAKGAGRIDRLVHLGARPVDPPGGGRGQARIHVQPGAQAFEKAVLQIAADLEQIGIEGFAAGLQERDIADRLDPVGRLVVAHLVGEQTAIAAGDLDVADRDDGLAGFVDLDLVRQQQHRPLVVLRLLGEGGRRREDRRQSGESGQSECGQPVDSADLRSGHEVTAFIPAERSAHSAVFQMYPLSRLPDVEAS